MQGDSPALKCVIQPEFSRKRQVLENRHVGPPSAVSQAREIATLFLSEDLLKAPTELLAIPLEDRDPFAIHRWVAEQHKPHKSWESLEEIMSMSDRRMQQILAVLALPSHLLFIADRYQLPDYVLREIMAKPESQWEALIAQAIKPEDEAPDDKQKQKPAQKALHQKATSGMKSFLRSISKSPTPKEDLGQVENELAVSKHALEEYEFLESVTKLVRLRLIDRGLIIDEEP